MDIHLSCDSKYQLTAYAGLMSGDEVAFAGGYFNNTNISYYLYGSNIGDNWWTISPSYYDPTLPSVGILMVNSSNGIFNDWSSASTIGEAHHIRPVITVDTTRINTGSGTSSDPYTFK